MQAQLVELISQEVAALNQRLSRPIDLSTGIDTRLFGEGGGLDSISLVTLIVAVEQAVEDEFEVCITLADEKAMSQRNSPFRSIAALAEYVEQRIAEEHQDA